VESFFHSLSNPLKKPFIAVHPGTSPKTLYKRWMPDHYAKLADRLIHELNATVIFTWGPDEMGWVEDQINESRNKWAKDLEEGETLRVGVNIFDETKEEAKIDIFHHSPDAEEKRRRYVQNYKKNRHQGETQHRLDQLYQKVRHEPETCCIPLIMDALEAKATSGEITDVFRKAYDFEIKM